MFRVRIESPKSLLTIGCLMFLLGAFCFWSPTSTATGGPTIIGMELIQTEAALQDDSCWGQLICVEQCIRLSDGTVEPMGKFCCVEGHKVGALEGCPMASRVNGPF